MNSCSEVNTLNESQKEVEKINGIFGVDFSNKVYWISKEWQKLRLWLKRLGILMIVKMFDE